MVDNEPIADVDVVSEVVDWDRAANPAVTRFETINGTASASDPVREFINGGGCDRHVNRVPVAAPEPEATAPRGPTLAPYREWTERPVPPVEQASASEVLKSLVEIVTAEGPMRAEWTYRRYVKASGKERLGSSIKATLNRIMYEAVRCGQLGQIEDNVVGQIGRTVYAPGSEPVVVRELGPRALDDVPQTEIRALAEALGLGSRPQVDVKRAVLAAYGRTMLTKTADKYLDEAFDYQR